MLNLERVQSLLKPYRALVVRGISDSGWFLDRAPYSSQGGSLPSIEAVKRGLPFWQGRIPANCRAAHPHQPWTCYFGYKLYPTISGKCQMKKIAKYFISRSFTIVYMVLMFFSSSFHIPMAFRRGPDDCGQCRCTRYETAVGLYPQNGRFSPKYI